jgi:hypothetical protein
MKTLPPIITRADLPLVKDWSTIGQKIRVVVENCRRKKYWRHRTGSVNLYSMEMQNENKKVHVYLKRNWAKFEMVYQKQKNMLQNKLLPTVECRNVYSVRTKEEQMLQFPASGERIFSSVWCSERLYLSPRLLSDDTEGLRIKSGRCVRLATKHLIVPVKSLSVFPSQ